MKVKKKLIHCRGCNKWLSVREWYLPDGMSGRVCCLKENHIMGYTWDKEYIKLFENEEWLTLAN